MQKRVSTAALLLASLLTVACHSNPQGVESSGAPEQTSAGEQAPASAGEQAAPENGAAAKNGEAATAASEGRVSFPTGSNRAEGVYVDRSAPAQLAMDQEFEYVMKVTNASAGAAHDVIVTEHTPAEGFTFISATPEAKMANGVLTWDLGTLKKGETRDITVKGKVSKEVDLEDCVSLTWQPRACVRSAVGTPKLALTKDEIENWEVNKPFAITYVAKNDGTGVVSNAVLRDTLAEGLLLVEGGGREVEAKLGDIKPGESKKFEVQVQAAKSGKYESPATVTGSGLTAQASDFTLIQSAELKVDKVGPAVSFPGVKTIYKIKVTNAGKIPAHHVVVRDILPAGVTYVSSAPEGKFAEGVVTWEIPEIAAGETSEIAVTLNPTVAGDIINAADARSDEETNPSRDEVKTSVGIVAALMLNVSDEPDPVQVGENVAYTITVDNQGVTDLHEVTPVCSFEKDAMEFVKAEGIDGEVKTEVVTRKDSEGKEHEYVVVTLPSVALIEGKKQTVWKVIGKAKIDGQYSFRTLIKASELKADLIKTEVTTFFGGEVNDPSLK